MYMKQFDLKLLSLYGILNKRLKEKMYDINKIIIVV